MRWIALGAVVALLALPVASVGEAAPKPEGVIWAGVHFTDVEAFRAWLGDHGVSYRRWVRLHPLGVYLMTHPRVESATAPSAGAVPAVAVAASSSGRRVTLVVVFLLAAAVLGGVGAASQRIVSRAGVPLYGEQVESLRVAALFGAVVSTFGAILAWWL
jgi:hypothetical protein